MRVRHFVCSGAQATAEFALVVPILVLTVAGLLEGGRLVYTVGVLQHAVQEGGRVAALPGTPGEAQVQKAVAKAAYYLNLAESKVMVKVNGGSTPYVQRQPRDRVSVSASYTYTPLFGMVFGGVASIPVARQTEIRVE